jgi:hypothetical protein
MATIYNFRELPIAGPGYEWIDRKGNILKIPDDSWDPILDNDKGRKLKESLSRSGYDGPGDWSPR